MTYFEGIYRGIQFEHQPYKVKRHPHPPEYNCYGELLSCPPLEKDAPVLESREPKLEDLDDYLA